ncbi:hypothetical protein CVV65_14650 [Kyrpidia spormannii]|uniref:HTH-like domain-containing protein n=2 Tax=Kyrpidia spormannii TaxID=2055160 RepID=A0A2K8N9N9_9BACL|nr:hypothetical protein CVV65_14650 [Kyrpidia spormannii]
MESIAGDGYAYGYRKLTHMLRQDYGFVINEKKVYRLCKELDILRPQRKIRRNTRGNWPGTVPSWHPISSGGRCEVRIYPWRGPILLCLVLPRCV